MRFHGRLTILASSLAPVSVLGFTASAASPAPQRHLILATSPIFGRDIGSHKSSAKRPPIATPLRSPRISLALGPRAAESVSRECSRFSFILTNFMKKMHRRKNPATAETIARMADKGKNVSRFFSNSGHVRKPIQRVNVDFTAGMLEELEDAAKELNISRQAVIKTLIRQGLAQRQTARSSRRLASRS
jgi:hypothetical protein